MRGAVLDQRPTLWTPLNSGAGLWGQGARMSTPGAAMESEWINPGVNLLVILWAAGIEARGGEARFTGERFMEDGSTNNAITGAVEADTWLRIVILGHSTLRWKLRLPGNPSGSWQSVPRYVQTAVRD